ncbi:MAG: hypothetical protein AMXMBFR56_12850 [Polyangiaceae bacterium]
MRGPLRAAMRTLTALAIFAGTARADLAGDAQKLAAGWATSGEVRRLPARFVERGGLRPLLLPAAFSDPLREDCVTVAVLGTTSSTFLLRFLPSNGALSWPDGEHPELSVAGGAQLVRCGVRKAMLERLALEMRSPRGAVEVLVARGARPFPPLTRLLAARSPGAFAGPGIAGPRAVPEPLERRIASHAARARRDGASAVSQRSVSADSAGRGRVRFELEPGCHRVSLLSGSAGQNVDLDADLALGASSEPVASDRSEAADATLGACLAERAIATLTFQGAAPGGGASLLVEHYPLPAELPPRWAPEERARIAQALRQHRGPSQLSAPVFTARGVSGITLLPLELEPDACYVAAVAAVRGQSAGVALSAELGRRQAQNHGGPDASGTTLAFCARGDASARLNVEVRGDGVAWLLGLFRAGRARVGEQAE